MFEFGVGVVGGPEAVSVEESMSSAKVGPSFSSMVATMLVDGQFKDKGWSFEFQDGAMREQTGRTSLFLDYFN